MCESPPVGAAHRQWGNAQRRSKDMGEGRNREIPRVASAILSEPHDQEDAPIRPGSMLTAGW